MARSQSLCEEVAISIAVWTVNNLFLEKKKTLAVQTENFLNITNIQPGCEFSNKCRPGM